MKLILTKIEGFSIIERNL